jgi:hypothetical protein
MVGGIISKTMSEIIQESRAAVLRKSAAMVLWATLRAPSKDPLIRVAGSSLAVVALMSAIELNRSAMLLCGNACN